MPEFQPADEHSARHAIESVRNHLPNADPRIVVDPLASRGVWLHDRLSGRDFLDATGAGGDRAISTSHPQVREPAYQARLLNAAALGRTGDPQRITEHVGDFVATMVDLAAPEGFERLILCDTPNAARSAAIRAAQCWKAARNADQDRDDEPVAVIAFATACNRSPADVSDEAGSDDGCATVQQRTADPTEHRLSAPTVDFSLSDDDRESDAAERENQTLAELDALLTEHAASICAVVIEPIRLDEGVGFFRPEFLGALRERCSQHDLALIFDETQTAGGVTGPIWAHEHFDTNSDMIVFGGRTQVAGVLLGTPVAAVSTSDEVTRTASALGRVALVDCVRGAQMLRILAAEDFLEHAMQRGAELRERIGNLTEQFAEITGIRGCGMLTGFDLADAATRDAFVDACRERWLLVQPAGERSIRLTPVLDMQTDDLDPLVDRLAAALEEVFADADADDVSTDAAENTAKVEEVAESVVAEDIPETAGVDAKASDDDGGWEDDPQDNAADGLERNDDDDYDAEADEEADEDFDDEDDDDEELEDRAGEQNALTAVNDDAGPADESERNPS